MTARSATELLEKYKGDAHLDIIGLCLLHHAGAGGVVQKLLESKGGPGKMELQDWPGVVVAGRGSSKRVVELRLDEANWGVIRELPPETMLPCLVLIDLSSCQALDSVPESISEWLLPRLYITDETPTFGVPDPI